jgi:hypothetical protein
VNLPISVSATSAYVQTRALSANGAALGSSGAGGLLLGGGGGPPPAPRPAALRFRRERKLLADRDVPVHAGLACLPGPADPGLPLETPGPAHRPLSACGRSSGVLVPAACRRQSRSGAGTDSGRWPWPCRR